MATCAFQIVNVFNLFITYGDTFLPNPNSYDELYYEIIRMHQSFGNLYSMGEWHHPEYWCQCVKSTGDTVVRR